MTQAPGNRDRTAQSPSDRKGGLTRRGFLHAGGAAMGAGVLSGGATIARGQQSSTGAGDARPAAGGAGAGRPRNVIFMMADGMSVGVPSLAEPFSKMIRDGQSTRWFQMLGDPDVATTLVRTDSASSLVTDSSAAASAWSIGHRINNGQVNVMPDGSRATPLAVPLKDAGKRVGLVTTDDITGASPASFAAVAEHRSQGDLIATQYLDRVDVLLGGGRQHFDPDRRDDHRDLHGEFKDAGYRMIHDREQLRGLKDGGGAPEDPQRVLGLFAGGEMPYDIDQEHQPDGRTAPTLTEMAQAAIDTLEHGDDGFFLMIEQAHVDHSAHRNDAAGLLWAQLTFDDAVAHVCDYARDRGDTLVILTTDHGNANPGLNGIGSHYNDSTECFHRLTQATVSFNVLLSHIHDRVRPTGDAEAQADAKSADHVNPAAVIKQVVQEDLAIKLTDAEADALVGPLLQHEPGEDINNFQRTNLSMLAQVLGNHTAVEFTSRNHTADMVLCSAMGPGSERFYRAQHHVDVAGYLRELQGVAAPSA